MYAIIGGSSLPHLEGLIIERREVVRTPYSEPSGTLTFGHINGCSMVFLARHGYEYRLPPHMINYRANIWALQSVGVKSIIAVSSVGAIPSNLLPGSLVIPDQLIDYTSDRKHTFFDTEGQPVTHVDFTEPYTARMRAHMLEAAENLQIPVVSSGVYGCTQGPRLETAAEINRLERDGCDMVGMTSMPEAALAREAGMEYANLCLVTNYAAGRGENLTVNQQTVLQNSLIHVHRVLTETVRTCLLYN